jgi:hypothetical protein
MWRHSDVIDTQFYVKPSFPALNFPYYVNFETDLEIVETYAYLNLSWHWFLNFAFLKTKILLSVLKIPNFSKTGRMAVLWSIFHICVQTLLFIGQKNHTTKNEEA